MALLNYSTTVPAAKSCAQIEEILSSHGANAITKEYDQYKQISALYFEVPFGDKVLSFRVPINPEAVLRILQREKSRNYRMRRTFTREQAVMIAWRIGKDWVEAQMALLDTEMVKLEQIFLPYMITPNGKTVFDMLSQSKYLMLEQPKDNL